MACGPGQPDHRTAGPQGRLGGRLVGAVTIDSTMLSVLLSTLKRLRPSGGQLGIVCSDRNIRKIFEITLLDRVFPIFASRDEAIDGLVPEAT